TLDRLGIPYQVEDTLVRGLDYYTHTVFEIVSINEKMGSQSTVLAGGRYDGLISYFGGPKEMSGIGWALGMERLIIALEAEGINLNEEDALDCFVMVLDQEAREYAFEVLTEIRAYGYRADMDYQSRSFKAQFKAADRKKAKTAILIGSSEMESGSVTVKLLDRKEQTTLPADELVSYLDVHLEEEEEHHHHHEEE
ncbi:His/Gly/Thr/Pro-type tRNA ligase C-terminal domain-containing protein, partial [Dubosiella newyorkensis]|uniref:His/Gly/Thr/Pro-type tRNA ligase C-terminal domain-containing protein n=1 Tax=Dubosiella newyorkensis TaxID=1862672 RepID=UPI0027302FC4